MVLLVHVKPNSKTDQIGKDELGNLKVKIRAQPVDGKANKYLEGYLSAFFGVSKSQVRILKGANTSHKRIEILASDELISARLETLEIL